MTRGASATSTSEPAARATLELAKGRLSALGVHARQGPISDPEGFLASLDTEVRWE